MKRPSLLQKPHVVAISSQHAMLAMHDTDGKQCLGRLCPGVPELPLFKVYVDSNGALEKSS